MNYISLIENPLIQTPSHRVHASSHFDLHFDLHQLQQRIKLTLEPNHDILPEGASITYLNANGEAYQTEDIQRHEHKVFKGEAWIQHHGGHWENVGWARVVIRRDGVNPLFEGAFTIHRNHHHIQLRSYYESTRHELDPGTHHSDDEYMVLFRDSDIGRVDHQELKRSEGLGQTCQAGQLSFNSDPAHKIFAPQQAPILQRTKGIWGATPIGSLFGKRQIDGNGIPSGGNSGSVNLKSSIGSTAGCPSTRKVALIGVVTDCSYTGTFDSKEDASKNVITQINTASNLYERSFSITLGLQNLTVTDAACPGVAPAATQWNIGCAGNTTITDRLNFFSEWRGERNDSNAYWTLLTNCATGAEVGLSWLGQLGVTTVQKSSGEVVSGANVVAKTNTEWQVIAHESGHTFGAVHDCDSQTCADSSTVNAQQCCPLSTSTCDAGAKYIMNPSTGEGISDFSPCSIGNICSALGRNSVNSSALVDNKGLTTVTGQQCGNGIVEDGEDCDCGGTASCGNNTCCNAQTCKFVGNAVCDESNEDCCTNCQYSSSGTVCRASTGECDPQETCSGTNATCPTDTTAPNGQKCGASGSNLQCASGQCTSRNQQCKTLMGSYTTNNDTYACNSQDCTLSCASPEFGPNVCYSMQQNFLDGTVCGGGGKCQNVSPMSSLHSDQDHDLINPPRQGQCKGSSPAKELGNYFQEHKNIVIPVCAGVGSLLLISILVCIIRCCRRPKQRKRSKKYRPQPPPMMMSSAWAGQGHGQGQGQGPEYWGNGTQHQGHRSPGEWGPGAGWQHLPPPIPPHYSQPSVRYA